MSSSEIIGFPGYLEYEQTRLRSLAEQRGVGQAEFEIEAKVFSQFERMGLSLESRILLTAINVLKDTVVHQSPQAGLDDKDIIPAVVAVIQNVKSEAAKRRVDIRSE